MNMIQFRDLQKQYEVLKPQIDAAMQKVCVQADFISGHEVKELEQQLAEYVGVKHCITCANGTDALTLVLMAWGIGPGDAILVPDFTFFASGETVTFEGATPLFVDVDKRTFNLDPDKLEETILQVKAQGKYNLRAVVAVDLFGLPADYPRIEAICKKYGLLLLEDGAQGFGGTVNGRRAGSFGDAATTSFFPAKPLGCYGDGGAVFTNNDEWAALIRSYAVHGKGGMKYDNVRIGLNSRLDTIQAAILTVKLKAFQNYELNAVEQVSRWYDEAFKDSGLALPYRPTGFTSSWAQYTVQLPQGTDREALQAKLREQGIPTMVYYPKPMHQQKAFAGTDSAVADCPVTERLCATVLSLPMHPYMTREENFCVANGVKNND